MLTYTNTVSGTDHGGTTYTTGAATLDGAHTYIFPWVATARPAVGEDEQGGLPIDESVRTATTCYMKGLKERIQVQTSSGVPWQWRRIAFTVKGWDPYSQDTNGYRWSLETSNGVVRVVNSVAGTTLGSTVVDFIFAGENGTDWLTPFSASLDTSRISVKYDKTRIIRSGNANGVMQNYKFWHSMEKNLVFNDDEAGTTEELNRFSILGKAGMGDFIIIDIIAAGTGGTTSDFLTFQPEATLYWHEK